jgi:hypothetical protein
MDLFILALSSSMTAALPPRPLWDEVSRHETMAACIIARNALPPWQQAYAQCFNAEQLAALQP